MTLFRSRLLTPGLRFFAAFCATALIAAFVWAITTSDQSPMNALLGTLSVGWKGGVGDHLGYAIFLGLAVVTGFLGLLLVAFRDADPDAQAQVIHSETLPLRRAPAGSNFVPIVGAFTVGVFVIGALTNRWVTLAGFLVLFGVIGVWTLRAWAERATGDDQVNNELYHRFIEPFRLPIVSIIVIAVVVIGLSRVLLAVSEVGAVVIFGAVGAAFLLVTALVAARPAISKSLITILLFIGAILIIGAGITAAVIGQRDFEEHQSDVGVTEGGLAPPGSVIVISPDSEVISS